MSENSKIFAGKTVLVTGASRGIGRAAALAFAKEGAHVLALARTTGGLEELDDEIRAAGGSASLIPLDLQDDNAIEQLASALGARFGSLDILFLNAASLGELSPLQDIAPKVWQSTLELNVTANWRLLRAFHPLLKKSDRAQVVFLSSRVGGALARAYWGVYAITKAALEMMAETFAEENPSMRAIVVDPGPKRTGMRAAAMPGEDPETLETPDVIMPMIFEDIVKGQDAFSKLVYREWRETK